MSVTARPEVPIQIITPKMVRDSIKRAKRNLWDAAEEIVWQVEMEGWRTLGYSSWGAMREAEYGEIAFMVPRQSRADLLERMRRAGLTQKEIAATAGVTERTVRSDLSTGNLSGSEDQQPITNSRGQQRPATYTRAERGDDVIDAEIVPDDTPIHVDTQTGEVLDAPHEKTDPAATESVTTTTCPTCHGTGKVTR